MNELIDCEDYFGSLSIMASLVDEVSMDIQANAAILDSFIWLLD